MCLALVQTSLVTRNRNSSLNIVHFFQLCPLNLFITLKELWPDFGLHL